MEWQGGRHEEGEGVMDINGRRLYEVGGCLEPEGGGKIESRYRSLQVWRNI